MNLAKQKLLNFERLAVIKKLSREIYLLTFKILKY